MMVLGMISALADTTLPGSITVKPTDSVSLTGKTLKAYRILDATYGSTGTLGGDPAQAVAYTIPASMLGFYDDYFKGDAASATAAADAANKTVDQFVAECIAALDTANLKDFEYKALAYAKDANKGNLTPAVGAKDGNNVKFTGLAAGYYVIEDEGTATPISALMLDTVTNANVDITLKAEDKTQKVIMTAGDLLNSKADELGLGRAVDYKITQEIPDTTGYDYFYYMINDTLSSGLTFNPDSLIVKVIKPAVPAKPAVGNPGDDDYQPAVDAQDPVTTELVKGTDYWLYYDNGAKQGDPDYDDQIAAILNGKTFIVAFDDAVSNAKINSGYGVEITYNATVNTDAVVGVNPNTNEVFVEYSNNPDKDKRGDWDEQHPGIPKNDGNHPTGVGPKKYTDTYATKILIKKVDAKGKALEGVEFTLTGTAKDANFEIYDVFDIDPTGEYWLLNDGTYTKQAPQTAATVEVTTGGAGWVEISGTGNDTVAKAIENDIPVRVVGDKSYRPYVPATDSAKTRYTIVEANAGDYASTTTKYKKNQVTANNSVDYDVQRTGITTKASANNDAIVSFSQLGAGTYKLAESGVLAGYNGIEDITFKVKCTLPAADKVIAGTEKASWEITDVTGGATFTAGTGDDLGTFVITIVNNSGVELPSTGGIGTTIFYIGGSVLVLAAAILLITKRRMSSND